MPTSVPIRLCLAAALLTGCASATKDISVTSETTAGIDFTSYHTYGWDDVASVINDPHGRWHAPGFDVLDYVKAEVDAALQKRGLLRRSTDPDLIVAAGAGLNMEALRGTDGADSTAGVNVPQSALVVMLVDRASQNVAWVGTATADVPDDPDDKTVQKRIEYAVDQLIKQLPE
jgi:hypothetical protein